MEGMFGQGRADLVGGSSAAFEAATKTPAPRGRRVVQIDALADSVHRHVDKAIVCIDLLMSSTSVVSSLAQGRRTLLAATLEEGRKRALGLAGALLLSEPGLAGAAVGDGGLLALESLADLSRDVVVISPSAQILYDAQAAPAVYVACLRNMSATAEHLARHHDRIALVGAGHAAEIRYEDQMVAAWIARKLVALGYEAADLHTALDVERWSHVDLSVAGLGRGAEHLRRLGRKRELDFVLSRVDDLDLACQFEDGEMRQVWLSPMRSAASH